MVFAFLPNQLFVVGIFVNIGRNNSFTQKNIQNNPCLSGCGRRHVAVEQDDGSHCIGVQRENDAWCSSRGASLVNPSGYAITYCLAGACSYRVGIGQNAHRYLRTICIC